MIKPKIVEFIEKTVGATLYPAIPRDGDPVASVMAFNRKIPLQYALRDGELAGLNLTGAGITDQTWAEISAHPDFKPERLEMLNLRSNKLRINPLNDEMRSLHLVDVSDNQLTEFAPPATTKNLKYFYLYGNEGLDPALQAAIMRGPIELAFYFAERNVQGEESLYEARLLITGEPRAGKTSLRRKLKNVANPLAEASTLGIDVDVDKENVFTCTTPEGESVEFRYQIWDFGGQKTYHPTHQLFFSKSTLYLLVTDTDRNKNEEDVEFWLESIQKLGEGSPVIRVENAPNNRDDETDWSGINKRFGAMIKDVFKINLDRVNRADKTKYDEGDERRFFELKRLIYTQLQTLEHVGSKVPAVWKKIRDDLAREATKQPVISYDTFKNICKKFKYEDESRMRSLSDTFHKLGIFLHFQDNPVLKNIVILQNEWAIDSVFAILDSELLGKTKGRFHRDHLGKIWNQEKYQGKSDELLELLLQFGLCYPLPADQGYVAPQRLPNSPPEKFIWDDTDNVRVDIRYDFLPRVVITRLIVDMHEFIAENKNWVWQNGVVFSGESRRWTQTQARVQEAYRKKTLSVWLRGPYSEDLFNEIQSKLHGIHRNYPNLLVDYIIYCNCPDCNMSDSPTPFNYQKDLLRYRRELGLEEIECRTKGKKVKIGDVLKGVISEEQAKNDERDAPVSVTVNLQNEIKLDMPNTTPNPEKANTGLYGALTAFIIVLPTIALTFSQLQVAAAISVCAITLLMLMLLLVYAGAHSGAFKEDTFVKISEGILRKIPGLSSLVNLIKGD